MPAVMLCDHGLPPHDPVTRSAGPRTHTRPARLKQAPRTGSGCQRPAATV